ncbi:MAG: ribosomal protein S18-alanine N-acetyltransferase [Gemmatimonadota bacterium]|nr:ribosomal protein S18-alanine N-acetyltransferase [Gemmatimonadota bacterium]
MTLEAALVRRARPDDVAELVRIEEASFTDPWSSDAFESLLLRDDADVLVAVSGEEVWGYAVVWTAADEAELANVAVAPGARRRGVGVRLVRAALETASQRGARTVYLEVRASNQGALRLYESLGFRHVGIRRGYYRRPVEDARVLVLGLPTSQDEGHAARG